MDSISQAAESDRQPFVAGTFYPGTDRALRENLDELFKLVIKQGVDPGTRALIVPHAGYVFSGEVAAAAYATIRDNTSYKNIFLLGSSHKASFPGASIYTRGDYITPIGKVSINKDIVKKLIDNSELFSFYPPAHSGEHSLEVQLPFIQYLFGDSIKIVPIILGTTNIATCESIAEILKPWFTNENLFVISSDFSHYPAYKDAQKIDKATAEALMTGKTSTFLNQIRKNMSKNIKNLSTCMCGWTSALVLLNLIQGDDSLQFKSILYKNSGDSRHGDKDRVVGYHAISVTESTGTVVKEEIEETAEGELPDSSDKIKLLKIARGSIESKLSGESTYIQEDIKSSPNINKILGAFVTLNLNGKLRGCIGRLIPKEPLWKLVSEMAIAAAFSDTRFDPVRKEEMKKIKIEISVLSPLKKINDISEIELGKHGVFIRKDFHSGTFLPQVAHGRSWSVEEFLGHISRDKAGLGWNGWREAEIFIYEAEIIEEE